MPALDEYARHSAFSDPRAATDAFLALAPEPAALQRAATAAIIHYRAYADELVDAQAWDIELRWLDQIAACAQSRQPGPLDAAREPGKRVAGCCRDHTLFCLGALRSHGIPARSRIGFCGYFAPPFHHDHVIVEWWDGTRWTRFDPELGDGPWPFDTRDIPSGVGSPFETAAEVWQELRAGRADGSTYGVAPELPELCGREFVREYVFLELAHRQRDELLLWDMFGASLPAGVEPVGHATFLRDDDALDALADEVAALLVAADAGDGAAEAELERRYATDARLNPSGGVVTVSPAGRVGDPDLAARVNRWRA